MLNTQKSLPTPGVPVHRLEGKSLRQWWQLDRSKTENKYRNVAIRGHLTFLAALPFFAIGAYHTVGPSAAGCILLSAAVWLAILIILLGAIKRHLNIVLGVEEADDGILVRSLSFLNRKIRWSEVRGFFPIQNGDFVLDCTNGDQYVLSSDLTESSKLYGNIKAKIPKPALSDDFSYRMPDELFDSANSACFALLVAVGFPMLNSLFYGMRYDLGGLAGSIILLFISCFIWWMHASRVAQLIRFSPSSLFIRTRSGSRTIALDPMVKIKKFAGYFIIKSRQDWCVIMAGSNKKEPLVAKLLECKENLPPPNRLIS